MSAADERRVERREKARAAFDRWRGFTHLGNYGYGVLAADRLREAWGAVNEWRDAHNQGRVTSDTMALAVRVTADTFASSILAAALPEHDADTVSWVVAGLRCPSQPFCTGCPSCQTVTSPLRPLGKPLTGAFG